ncbi:MAG: FHA domain-containing protein [Planctomycetota bacterium]|nr:FHA domain-containing protein [Planctomycetota bacterium]
MQVSLKVLSGAHEGKLIQIKDEKFLIGRGDSCQLRPKSESISRKHCAIVQKDGRLLLVDLKSRNGTFVNEKQVSPEKAKILKNGDRLRCGQLEFEVLLEVGIANSKQPEVQSVKDAAGRMTEQSNLDSKESVDISSWLSEADQIDRSVPAASDEFDTRQIAMEDTTRLDSTQLSETEAAPAPASELAKLKRPDKREPIKLPKQAATGPATKDTKAAASETLKKYFGGR